MEKVVPAADVGAQVNRGGIKTRDQDTPVLLEDGDDGGHDVLDVDDGSDDDGEQDTAVYSSDDMDDDDDDNDDDERRGGEGGDHTSEDKTPKKLSSLIPSPFPTRLPVLRFSYGGDNVEVEGLDPKLREGLRWKFQSTTPNLVKKMVRRIGFHITERNGWIGTWGKHIKATSFRHLRADQKLNHYPRHVLSPWRHAAAEARLGRCRQCWKWILKPNASARGIGIRVIYQWSQVPKRKNYLVQRYLSKPYLINDAKFDLRVYVYVSSFDPLKVYICREGLARFATQKYSNKKSKLRNRYMHLTNYSINKKSSKFVQNDDVGVCQGHKWGLQALWKYMREHDGVDTDQVWDNICDIVIKTLLSVDSVINSAVKFNCKSRRVCHELFGFDIMLASNLKPYLIEVNISPSMASSSPLDKDIKGERCARKGDLDRLVPSPTFESHFRFMDTPRYYNMLLCEWSKRYHLSPGKGVEFLQTIGEEALARAQSGSTRTRQLPSSHATSFTSKNQFYMAPTKPKGRHQLPSLARSRSQASGSASSTTTTTTTTTTATHRLGVPAGKQEEQGHEEQGEEVVVAEYVEAGEDSSGNLRAARAVAISSAPTPRKQQREDDLERARERVAKGQRLRRVVSTGSSTSSSGRTTRGSEAGSAGSERTVVLAASGRPRPPVAAADDGKHGSWRKARRRSWQRARGGRRDRGDWSDRSNVSDGRSNADDGGGGDDDGGWTDVPSGYDFDAGVAAFDEAEGEECEDEDVEDEEDTADGGGDGGDGDMCTNGRVDGGLTVDESFLDDDVHVVWPHGRRSSGGSELKGEQLLSAVLRDTNKGRHRQHRQHPRPVFRTSARSSRSSSRGSSRPGSALLLRSPTHPHTSPLPPPGAEDMDVKNWSARSSLQATLSSTLEPALQQALRESTEEEEEEEEEESNGDGGVGNGGVGNGGVGVGGGGGCDDGFRQDERDRQYSDRSMSAILLQRHNPRGSPTRRGSNTSTTNAAGGGARGGVLGGLVQRPPSGRPTSSQQQQRWSASSRIASASRGLHRRRDVTSARRARGTGSATQRPAGSARQRSVSNINLAFTIGPAPVQQQHLRGGSGGRAADTSRPLHTSRRNQGRPLSIMGTRCDSASKRGRDGSGGSGRGSARQQHGERRNASGQRATTAAAMMNTPAVPVAEATTAQMMARLARFS
ncbi:hypothetical protein PTSG_00722 [Salpingoeca rosetta]|uniref:Uncharacterized protein n=1 Tax=Salpingoeca rosetta (strain ATCC 50818 / BSB-021) TaxID=946362 RepID=F2TXA5_SALR5|nr:uncharacterized protein PTSG_00722 [Salpingoeca rosetta]EGD76014.1 hypothetical protein PTSG_00722 [Salpingoeca rosetta]|eukprot:XP_004998189.1 hypothetical protein PTSG_00722 [Salpingoeca rosetta]